MPRRFLASKGSGTGVCWKPKAAEIVAASLLGGSAACETDANRGATAAASIRLRRVNELMTAPWEWRACKLSTGLLPGQSARFPSQAGVLSKFARAEQVRVTQAEPADVGNQGDREHVQTSDGSADQCGADDGLP